MADAKDKKSKPADKPRKDDADGGDDDGGDGKVPEGFNAWPSIVLLSNVATSFRKCAAMKTEGKAFEPFSSWLDKPITYRSKVKLHGQNGAVNITADQVQVQSRNQFLPKSGKFGKVVCGGANDAYWSSLFDKSAGYQRLTVFGEFAGPGVQKGVSLASLKEVIFAVFGVEVGAGQLMIEPDQITSLLTKNGTLSLPKNVYVLPWFSVTSTLIFNNDEKMKAPLEEINTNVSAIDSEDPWVLKTFGVKGNGEGLVLYPTNMSEEKTKFLSKQNFSDFAFKAKGEKHRTVATTKAADTKAPAAEGVTKFVEMVLTKARFEQGVQSVGGFDKKNTGKFVKWVCDDVQKECKDELTASKLTWKEVNGAVTKAAQTWWMAQQPKDAAAGGGAGKKKPAGDDE